MTHRRLVVETQVLEGRRVFVARQPGVARSWTARAGRPQAREHVRVRDDLERLRAFRSEPQVLEGRRVFVARQPGVARSWTARAGRPQAREHVRVRDDLERLRAV